MRYLSLLLFLVFCDLPARAQQGGRQLVPSGMALLDHGKWLVVCLSRTGDISLVHTGTGQVITKTLPGVHGVDLVAVSDDRFAVLNRDVSTRQIVIYQLDPVELVPEEVYAIPSPNQLAQSDPFTWLALSPNGNHFAAASDQFSVQFFPTEVTGLKPVGHPHRQLSSPLRFLPGNDSQLLVPSPDHQSLYLKQPGQPDRKYDLPVQNISGIALDEEGSHAVLTAQRISRLARTSFDDIHWGSLVTSELRCIPLDALRVDAVQSRSVRIGEVANPAPDPSAIVAISNVTFLVALSGSNEIGVFQTGSAAKREEYRIKVGHRPSRLLFDKIRQTLYAANSLGNSISIINTQTMVVEKEIRLQPGVNLTEAELGEQLFFSASLSHDGWMSCHTCHPNGGSHDYMIDTFSDGGYGNPKRSLDLHGIAGTAPYAWNGSKPDLQIQIRDSLDTTMRLGREPAENEISQLTAFLESLSRTAKGRGGTDGKGESLFEELKCNRCHPAPEYTSQKVYDIGMRDETGLSEFNPPTLRGLEQRHRFFHDGRAPDLQSVFEDYRHQLGDRSLSKEEMEMLLSFLRSL